jgi:uncharacterized membrane protein YkoI
MSVAFTRSMKLFTRNLSAPLMAALILVGGTIAAMADDDDARDHELARQALTEGRIRPLAEITNSFKAQFAGEIVGVELEVKVKAANGFVYEFKVLTPDGKLKEVKVDAKTAKILKIEDDD